MACSICALRYKTPKEIPVVFHNGSTFDYHFIFNQRAKGSEGQFGCIGGITERDITFSVPIKKELDNGKTIISKLKFIDSLDLCKAHYQKCFMTYLKFTKKNEKYAWKEKNQISKQFYWA